MISHNRIKNKIILKKIQNIQSITRTFFVSKNEKQTKLKKEKKRKLSAPEGSCSGVEASPPNARRDDIYFRQ